MYTNKQLPGFPETAIEAPRLMIRKQYAQQSAIAPVSAGLGLRRSILAQLRDAPQHDFDFLEIAPENWIGIGGAHGKALAALAERHPLSCHGLSLSLGGTAPLDETFLKEVRTFLDHFGISNYSEHLSYCTDEAHLYDLLPLPFTEEAIHHVAGRIRRAQDILGRRLAVENVSYYAAPRQDIDEVAFTNAVLQEADCDLLLDVNNVFVNAINHKFNPIGYLDSIAADRVVGYHVAGHYDQADDLKIDTHGAPVKPAVWSLLTEAYRRFGVQPTLLERDFNFPPYAQLVQELNCIRQLQQQALQSARKIAHA